MERRDRIKQAYTEHLLDHGDQPASVYSFVKSLEISEREFYEEFASFDAVEAQVWLGMLESAHQSVTDSPEWEEFNARQRFLTLLYAFFEKALDHRSFLLVRFPCAATRARGASSAERLRQHLEETSLQIIQAGIDSGEIGSRGPLARLYPRSFAELFLSTIDFYLRDESKGFERTDAYIEKTSTLAFDLIGSSAIDSAVDLVRFLTQRTDIPSPRP